MLAERSPKPARQPGRIADLLPIILPHGGYVMTYAAYFDESYQGSPYFVYGGVLVRDYQIPIMQKEWDEVLGQYGLEFFHAVECNNTNKVTGMGLKSCAHLDLKQRIRLQRRMIEIIGRRITIGCCAAIRIADFDDAPKSTWVPDIYTFALRRSLLCYSAELGPVKGREGIAYVFEQGHEDEPQACAAIARVFRDSSVAPDYRHTSHTFMPKRSAAGLQAADLLAWHQRKDLALLDTGQRERADFRKMVKQGGLHCEVMSREAILQVCGELAALDAQGIRND